MNVFLSCVSNELKSYRLKLANQLCALKDHPFEVKVQEDFQQGGYTLLDKLADYVRECDLVIHLAGDACGARPTAEHIRALLHRLGEQSPDPLPDWSYTQWEYQLGLRFERKMLVYFAAAEAPRDCGLPVKQTDQESRLQQAHLDTIRQSGKHYRGFTSYNTLVQKVFLDLGLQAELKVNNLPYKSLASLFKGRDDFLVKIHGTLARLVYHGFESSATISASVSAVAVHGLGGAGKTRLAIEYAHRYAEEYTALLFVLADSPSGLQQNLAALCGPMIFDLPEKDTKEIDVQVAAVLHWLQQHAGWLLIFDNADSDEVAQAVQDLMGKLTPSGQVLITSRLSNWPGSMESLAIDVLQEDDAAAFLLERTQDRRRKTTDDDALAHKVAVELGQLALALEQAGAYVERYRFTFAEYLAEWLGRRDTVLEWFDPRLMHYPMSVAVTWQTSFDRLSDVARQLLRLFAWFAPDPVPESLLQVGGETLVPIAREGLADLEEHSLLLRADETVSFTVHRLVQDVTRRRSLQGLDYIDDLTAALRWVNGAWVHNPQDVRTWPVLATLVPHALTLIRYADAEHISDPTARLMGELAAFYHTQAQYAEAEPLYRRALAIDEIAHGPDHIDVAKDLNNLAALLYSTNRLDEAEPLYRRALAINEVFYGSHDPSVAKDLTNLAQLLQATNRMDEGEPLMRQALEIFEKAYGENHADVGMGLNNLGRLLQNTNRLDDAEPLLRRSVKILEETYGPDHPLLATAITNLAQLQKDRNRINEAEPLMRRALAIDEKAYGPEHPDVGRDLNNLGTLLYRTNRFTEAEPLLRRALAIDEKAYGTDHPDVARDLNNLAALLQDTNRLGEAETALRRVVKIFKGSYGADHPKVATGLNNLAALLLDTDRLNEAEPLLRQAIAIDEKAGGPNDPNVARDLGNLARLLQNAKRLGEAEPLMRRVVKIYEMASEPDRPNLAISINNLATFLYRANQFEEAEALMWRALAIDEKVYGPSHPILFTDLTNLAILLRSAKRQSEAEPLLRRALEIIFQLARDTGQQHPYLQAAMVNYAGVLEQMGYGPDQIRARQNEIANNYGFSLSS